MPIYSLYLTSREVTDYPNNSEIRYVSFRPYGTLPSSLFKFSVTWNINYDALFRGENFNYRKCRLRAKTLCNKAPDDYSQALGNLCGSFKTTYNCAETNSPTLLGVSYTIQNRVDLVDPFFTEYYFDTMQTPAGVNICVPTGNDFLTLNFASAYEYVKLLPDGEFYANYLLQFELYDKISA